MRLIDTYAVLIPYRQSFRRLLWMYYAPRTTFVWTLARSRNPCATVFRSVPRSVVGYKSRNGTTAQSSVVSTLLGAGPVHCEDTRGTRWLAR